MKKKKKICQIHELSPFTVEQCNPDDEDEDPSSLHRGLRLFRFISRRCHVGFMFNDCVTFWVMLLSMFKQIPFNVCSKPVKPGCHLFSILFLSFFEWVMTKTPLLLSNNVLAVCGLPTFRESFLSSHFWFLCQICSLSLLKNRTELFALEILACFSLDQ